MWLEMVDNELFTMKTTKGIYFLPSSKHRELTSYIVFDFQQKQHDHFGVRCSAPVPSSSVLYDLNILL